MFLNHLRGANLSAPSREGNGAHLSRISNSSLLAMERIYEVLLKLKFMKDHIKFGVLSN